MGDQDKGDEKEPSLAEQLGISGLRQKKLAIDGRFFDAAGDSSPIAEFADGFLVFHPPQKPLKDKGPSEEITLHVDERGVLLDARRQPRKIPAALFKGRELFVLGETKPATMKHLVACLDQGGKLNKLYLEEEPLTLDQALRLRNQTFDGEISVFPELRSDEKK
jgi:hypothetical protein